MTISHNPAGRRATEFHAARRKALISGGCALTLWAILVIATGNARWWTVFYIAGIAVLLVWPLSAMAALWATWLRRRPYGQRQR